MDDLPVSIRHAARAVHRSQRVIRKLVEDGFLTAYRAGGSDSAPRLRVYVQETRVALAEASVYVPKGAKRSPRKLHPQAMAMLRQ
jgi:hypothetical protein